MYNQRELNKRIQMFYTDNEIMRAGLKSLLRLAIKNQDYDLMIELETQLEEFTYE